MMSESGVKATAHNPNGDASGLIQFMPKILVGLGWTSGPDAFRELSAEEQLPFVEKFFTPYVPKGLSSAARLYQATFLPATLDLGSEPNTVICQQGGINSFAYGPNKVFDRDGDGAITVGELQAAIDRNTQGPRWAEIVARLNGTALDETIHLQTLEGVQRALRALGFDPGTIDGIDGSHWGCPSPRSGETTRGPSGVPLTLPSMEARSIPIACGSSAEKTATSLTSGRANSLMVGLAYPSSGVTGHLCLTLGLVLLSGLGHLFPIMSTSSRITTSSAMTARLPS